MSAGGIWGKYVFGTLKRMWGGYARGRVAAKPGREINNKTIITYKPFLTSIPF